jgi:hypothetical protein
MESCYGYIFMKESSLFLVFCFIMLISPKSQHLATFLVPLEGPQCLRVHQVGLIIL